MRSQSRTPILFACTFLLFVSLAPLAMSQTAPVSQERLLHPEKEPQNWLMMNGDYASTRYSKLDQINREQREESADGLGAGPRRHAGCRDRTAGERGQPAHRQRLHVHDRRLGHHLQDRRARSRASGEFVWVTDPGVKHQGNVPRTRGIALWEDLVIANLPDGRVIAVNRDNGEIVWDKMVAVTNEFGSRERFFTAPITAEGKVIVAQRRRRRRDARLDGGARREDRQGAVALVRRAQAGRPRQRDLEGRSQRVEDRRRRHLADRLLRSGDASCTSVGTGNPIPDVRPAVPSRRQPLHQLGRRARTSIPASSPGTSSTRRTTRGTTTKSASTCCTTPRSTASDARSSGHFARNGFFYTLDRTNGKFIKAGQYVNDLNWTKGIDPEDRQAGRIQSEARRADLQSRGARAARRRQEAHLPDVARRRRPPAHRIQSGEAHRVRRGHRRMLLAERRSGGVPVARRRHRRRRTARSARSAAISTTAR